ncbi:MAG: hypothetical protein FJ288_09495, partial [Planctomycetes bacterium]|nr:hypothetical protein [Planctomycetota bacterium]
DIPSGAYTLTPAKTDDVAEITAYDASLVLRAAVGLITLTPDQVLAADVNRNGMVTSMDAFYILQKSVELIDVPFPGAGRVWLFKPENRPYSLLVADQTGQNFTAILIGDVSGNWTHPGGGQGGVIPLNSPSAALLLPTVESHNAEQVVLPLSITFAGVEVYSADIIISYDVSALALESVAPGAVAAGCGYAFNTSQPGVIRAGFASSQPLAAGGTLMELTFDVVGTLQAPAPVSFVVAELNEGQIEASAHDGSVRDTIAPSVDAVELNQRAGRGVGAVDPSGLGVRTITLNFSERVNFSPDAVLVQKVAFPGGVETLGEALEPLAVSGFNTSAMQITLAPGAAVDTWVKVTLDTALLADPAGNRLAGGAIGPAAAFYVGSLRGDFDGDLAIGPDDRQGFRNAWLAGSPDADFRGVGFGPRPPDGRITLADIDGFTSVYQAGLALGRHLDPLPTSGGGLASNVVPLPALAMPDSGVDALAHARGLLPPSDQPPLVPTRQQASPSGESREDVRDALRLRRLRPAAAPPSAPAALMRLPDTLSSSIPIIS